MTILLVEDDFLSLRNLEKVLDDMSHNTLLGSNPAGALVHLLANQPSDTLFVDIRLDVILFGGYDGADQAVGLRTYLPAL